MVLEQAQVGADPTADDGNAYGDVNVDMLQGASAAPMVMVHLTKPESGGYGLSVTESPDGGIFVTGVKEGGEAWKSGMIHPHMRIIELNQVDATNVSAVSVRFTVARLFTLFKLCLI